MPSYLIDRLASQIQRELSILLQRDVKDTKVGYVTVTEVRLTNDESFAYVYYNVLGSQDKDRLAVTQKALENAEGFIKKEISKKVKMRKIPTYIFKYDDSLERGKHINDLLEEIKAKENDEK